MKIRLATDDDCGTLWKWINDSDVRTASLRSGAVTLGEHVAWFKRKLTEPSTKIYMVEVGDSAIGVVRFEDGMVSVTIDRAFRNVGYGAQALRMASNIYREETGKAITAHIKEDNTRSISAFRNAGYVFGGRKIVNGLSVIVMTFGELLNIEREMDK